MTIMFPLVSYSLNVRNNSAPASSGAIASYVTGSSKLLVPGRVTAATKIAQGAMTIPVDPMHLLGQPDVQQISVGTNSYGTIDLEDKSKETWSKTTHWIRALRLSDDCHSYNMQLRLQPSQRPCSTLNKNLPTPKLILQAVRPIEMGQELLLWFSEDILAMLQIVFLTPANIQGQKKYVCTRCSSLYESPNPLKLHITLGCGRSDICSLWEKLSAMMTESTLQKILKHEYFEFKLTPEPEVFRQKSAIDLTTSNLNKTDSSKNLYRPYNEPSAFKPFKKNAENSTPLREIPTVWPMAIEHPERQLQNFNINIGAVNYNDEAHIESLVSSLGKSKQGHICLYCGKCYSRKYGLKIHIRTHTGYKPLKCKFCSRPFGDPSNLNKHVRLHAEGNTPYKCDLCGKILVRRRDLERHLKSRHMIEMHPDLNILPDSPTQEVEASDEDSTKQSSTSTNNLTDV
ncbi:unnamed protein product [Brassicogethes aeneus]|uniref:C2H2-type domain-containing protein n=1 Tax=Brassicogethes aeneus TaxID=1431903 RepID=A0A9P0B7P1_BRAAE|nr:unnamed protein product [Brassicogethes aeneus]